MRTTTLALSQCSKTVTVSSEPRSGLRKPSIRKGMHIQILRKAVKFAKHQIEVVLQFEQKQLCILKQLFLHATARRCVPLQVTLTRHRQQ
jgi:hypothetical protein